MHSPAEVTFRQVRSRFLHDDIVLRHDRVIIRRGLSSSPGERHVRLEDLSPDIEVTEQRPIAVLWVVLLIGAMFAAAAWRVSGPDTMSFALSAFFGCLALSSVLAGFVACAPVPVATLKSRRGEILFQLTRNRDVAADYEEFLLRLQRRLRDRNGDSSP